MKILDIPGILSVFFSFLITFRDFCNREILNIIISFKGSLELLLLILSIIYVSIQIYYQYQRCREKKMEMKEMEDLKQIKKDYNS